MANRYEQSYFVTANANDGYVVHDISLFVETAASLLIGWQDYTDSGDCDSFLSFDNIDIPNGSTVVSAHLRLNLYRCYNGYVETELKISDANDIPTDYSEFDALNGGEQFLPIHIDPQSEEQIFIYDVTELVKEKIEGQDWAALNNIVFFTENTTKETADSSIDFDAYEYNPISELTIIFEPPEEITLNDIFENSRLERFEYEKLSLDANNIYIHDGYLDDYIQPGGTINNNFDRDIIGSINLNLNNDADFNYISDLIRPWYCITYNSIEYKFPLGTYFLFSPKIQSDGNYVERPAYGYDMLYALEQDKIDASVTYSSGETVTDIIYDILDNVGNWVKYNIPESSETLVEDASYEIGKSKLFILNSLLNKINYYPLWSSGRGIYRSVPWSDIYKISWEFIDNDKSLYTPGILESIDYTQIYNKVIIYARQLTADTEPLYKVLTFEDIDMDDYPLSYTSIGRYITKIFQSEATSQSYVDLRAERELRKMTEIEDSITYKHAFVSGRFGDGLPYQGDAFKFKNTLLNIDYDYKIESMKFTLNTGKLVNTTIRRVINE